MYAFVLTDAESNHVISEDDVIIDSLARSCVSCFISIVYDSLLNLAIFVNP